MRRDRGGVVRSGPPGFILLAEFLAAEDVGEANEQAHRILDEADVELMEDVDSVAAELGAVASRATGAVR